MSGLLGNPGFCGDGKVSVGVPMKDHTDSMLSNFQSTVGHCMMQGAFAVCELIS